MLLRELVRSGPSTASLDVLRKVLDERVDDPDDEVGKDALASRQASAGIALAALGEPDSLWRLLRHRGDPRLRTLLIQRLAGGDAQCAASRGPANAAGHRFRRAPGDSAGLGGDAPGRTRRSGQGDGHRPGPGPVPRRP